jgi:hypothetical protein
MKDRKKPKYTTAVNLRKQPFKYYYVNDVKRFAVPAGRCYKCNKITDAFCDKCKEWVCEKHFIKPEKSEYEIFCLKCK